jgi:hypothetical protein
VAVEHDEPQRTPTPAEAIADEAAEWPREAWSEPRRRERTSARTTSPREPRPSSARGGAILLGSIAALIVVLILVIVLIAGGGSKTPLAKTAGNGGSTTTPARSTTVTTQQKTTATTTSQPLAQLNLTSPSGAKSTVGIVVVERVDGVVGMVIDAQGVPANTAHNAYAVWLYNSASSFKFVGFVPNLVSKTGKLSTEGKLPADASKYGRLLITLETEQKPKAPGEVVLSGRFRE